MPAETIAQASAPSGAPDEDDFPAEYARRNRNADTEQLLTAIEQL